MPAPKEKTLTIYLLYYSTMALGFMFLSLRNFHSERLFGILIFFFLGLIFWTLFEYILHRYIFHLKFSIPGLKIFNRDHLNHHRDLHFSKIHFLDPFQGSLVILLIWIVFYLVINSQSFVFMSGFTFGYICYVLIHRAIHKTTESIGIIKKLKKHHLTHHTKYPNKAFGVSNTFWDWVFGTLPKNI